MKRPSAPKKQEVNRYAVICTYDLVIHRWTESWFSDPVVCRTDRSGNDRSGCDAFPCGGCRSCIDLLDSAGAGFGVSDLKDSLSFIEKENGYERDDV